MPGADGGADSGAAAGAAGGAAPAAAPAPAPKPKDAGVGRPEGDGGGAGGAGRRLGRSRPGAVCGVWGAAMTPCPSRGAAAEGGAKGGAMAPRDGDGEGGDACGKSVEVRSRPLPPARAPAVAAPAAALPPRRRPRRDPRRGPLGAPPPALLTAPFPSHPQGSDYAMFAQPGAAGAPTVP